MRVPSFVGHSMRRLVLRRSPIHGNGVFATVGLPAGIALVEYRGRRMTHAQADRLYADTADSGHTFLFVLDDRWLIDANVGGNVARWINHGCEPNCQAVIHPSANDNPREQTVMIESIRPIRPGDELTYDYGIVLEERHTPELKRIWSCRCGSPRCSGTLLQPRRRKRRAAAAGAPS